MVAVLVLSTACTDDKDAAPPATVPTTVDALPAEARPNIVFVLADDFSMDLLQFMPRVHEMQRRGATFSHYFVTDSLCCPSRASIFTGRFPHSTGIYRNQGRDGGFEAFRDKGLERDTFATSMQAAGYRTGMLGKYLNGYLPRGAAGQPPPPVPPGWDTWAVGGNAYGGFDYFLNENGSPVHYGTRPEDYITDVLADKAVKFIADAADAKRPFVLEVSAYTPHQPYAAASRHTDDLPGLKAPRNPAFNATPDPAAPAWLRSHGPLSASQIAEVDEGFRKRAQTVLSIDELIGRVEKALAAEGIDDETYVVFSSDNGFHMGAHRMMPGKMTAFDHDVNVPLIVTGPRVKPGAVLDHLTENIDLRPTFEEMGGLKPAPDVDGRSLLSLLHGNSPAEWRTSVLIEHRGPVQAPDDPDAPGDAGANPPTYEAVRTRDALFVEYADGVTEFYDLMQDPHALKNTAAALSRERRAALHDTLLASRSCRGANACWSAQTSRV